jgi:hypothetical protein
VEAKAGKVQGEGIEIEEAHAGVTCAVEMRQSDEVQNETEKNKKKN